MDSLLRDFRLAFRTLFRKPGVTALAIASLGLALGFSTAAFSILDAHALRDLPVTDPTRLVSLNALTREKRGDGFTWIEYQALASSVHSFSGVIVEDRESPAVKLPDRTDRPISGYVSDNYFDVLGVKAAMGDVFHAGKGQPGTAVVSQHYWKEKLDPDRRMLLASGMYDGVPSPEAAIRASAAAAGIARLPRVEGVAWARRVMLSGSGGGAVTDVEVAGQPKLTFPYNQVSPGYFDTTGARVLSGRAFTDGDGPDATQVVMVNSLFARRFFGLKDPLGTWIKAGGRERQIVGIVEDGPHNHLRERPTPYVYFPFAQRPVFYLTWMIHTSRDPGDFAGAFRKHMRSEDPGFTLLSVRTFHEHMRAARSDQEVGVQVAGSLAGVGLLLAAAGLFGVTLFAVAKRTPEFGVRAAMGASPRDLARLVLREAGVRVAIALPLGWGLAYAGRHAISKLLYGVAADDPWTFAAASAVVAAVASAAALYPALRAARIDPMTALRHE